MSPMIEVELKFQVPAAAWRDVEAAVARGASHRTRLEAVYFDTPDRRLAAAGIALRLRREGRRWVQTAKASAADPMQRLEHNVVLAGGFGAAADRIAVADPLRHAATPLGERLAAALAPRAGEAAAPPLAARYRSVVWRRHRPLRAAGATVDLAFDRGHLVAGDLREPVCELEIELLHGRPAAVIDAARRWVGRYGVWLDVRSKSMRGERLAQGVVRGPAVKATPLVLDSAMRADAALHAVIANCLLQILPNAAEVASATASGAAAGRQGMAGGKEGGTVPGKAAGKGAGKAAAHAAAQADGKAARKAARYSDSAGHVHQLRVGLRRLRSALRFFDGWTARPDPSWIESLERLFRQLGAARDRDALAASLLPELQAAGAPLFELPAAPPGPTPSELMRAPATTLTLLDLLAFQLELHSPSPSRADDTPRSGKPRACLAQAAARRLDRWHRRIVRSAQHYAEASDEDRHRLRKRVKRQRYATEFVATLYRDDAVARYVALLAPLQDSLGRYNDVCVGLEAYRAAVGDDPRAWFAIGWLTARRDALLAESARALDRFAASERFWDKPERRQKAGRRDDRAAPRV